MKIILRTIFPAILLMTFLSSSALAQTKIATVDLKKLFDNYYKTKLAQAAIQDRKTQLDKDDRSMRDDLKKGTDDYQNLLEEANDQAISSDERDRRKKEADDKLKQLQASQTALDQYERQAQVTLTDQMQRMHEKILDEIEAAVATQARAGGFTLVLNTFADVNASPTVVFSSGENDLTDAVLKQLNAGAPIDTTPASPLTSPPPSLLSTNRP